MAPPLKQPIKENWQIDQGAIGEIQNSQSSMRHSIRITTEFEIQKGRHNSKKNKNKRQFQSEFDSNIKSGNQQLNKTYTEAPEATI